MPRTQLSIGLYAEGNTDIRFLASIVQRTFEDICFECQGELEVFDVYTIEICKSTFSESVINASRKGTNEFGIMILCVHTDADNQTDTNAYQNKISPAISALENCDEDICKQIVPIIPIQMTESWMLADKSLFKKMIGTNKSDNDLGIYKAPEEYANPKEVIKEAIKIAVQERPKRRKGDLRIEELYQLIGQSLAIEELKKVPSFLNFQNNIREVLRKMKYLH